MRNAGEPIAVLRWVAECGKGALPDRGVFIIPHSAFRIRIAKMSHRHHRRFFVPPADIRDGRVAFSAAQVHQCRRVLRLGAGDDVAVFDGTGRELRAVLEAAEPGSLRGRVVAERCVPPSTPSVTLAQVVPRGPAMDQIVAHATELGVRRLVPLLAARSVRQVADRVPRWLRIAREAAEQCGRVDVPEVAEPRPLATFLAELPPGCPLLVCDADAREPLLAACRALAGAPGVALLLGGEGGLSADETAGLTARRATFVSLGPRLLRAPTAALAALAILQAGLAPATLVEP